MVHAPADAHTTNLRRLPSVGGAGRGRSAPTGADRAAAAEDARLRPRARSIASNWTGRVPAGVMLAAAGALGPSVAVRSWNGADTLKVLAADWGTRRYSAESSVEAFAAIVRHPPFDAGSMDTYCATVRVSGDACAALHVGVTGPAV